MNTSKLFLVALSALTVLGGCKDTKTDEPQVQEKLEIFYADKSNILPSEGGKAVVLVNSTGEWTLEGSYDFVTPSATSGKDGAEVTFTASANKSDKDQTADYRFKSGSKEVAYRLVVKGRSGTSEKIEVVSKPEMRIAHSQDDRVAVKLKTNVAHRDLTAEITAEGDWLAWSIARPTDDGGADEVTAYFKAQANTTGKSREATVKIKGASDGEATVKMTQLPAPQLSTDKTAYFVGVEAQELEVTVTTNLEFDVAVGEGGNGWLTYKNYADGKLHFSLTALDGGTARESEVTLTEKNGPDNAEATKLTFTVTQKPKGLIEKVADMRASRCYFPSPMKNEAALKTLGAGGSMEALVNIQEARKNGAISTIMGIENDFLLRLGDVGVAWNQIQLATYSGNVTSPDPKALTLSETNKWYHIAVTWNDVTDFNSVVKFYIDGKLVYTHNNLYCYSGLNFSKTYDPSKGEGEWTRAFWIGYSYDAGRTFPGYMSEVRVWNRPLSEEEINAKDHFYSVPVDSEGLVGYWKLDGGEGDAVKDYSKSGNDMKGEIDVRADGGGKQVGDPGMKWVEMSLP